MKTIVKTLICIVFTSNIYSQTIINIPDENWSLWPDTAAKWENDHLFLPGEFHIDSLPVNPPTTGWRSLYTLDSKLIDLPSTVEEHFWGELGYTKYHDSYTFENSDQHVKDGSYKGVSWWWKKVFIPGHFKGKKVFLKIRAARLRAEVYLNKQLVGYHLIGETAFQCDISDALIPGQKNMLAIRITNPGGRFDWLDVETMKWGDYEFHSSHGFGGLDRGLTIEAHDSVFISDMWVLNQPDLTQATAYFKICNTSSKSLVGNIHFVIQDSAENILASFYNVPVDIAPVADTIVTYKFTLENAEPWELKNPLMYKLNASLEVPYETPDGTKMKYNDRRIVNFGFRWFETEGIGDNAILKFNHKRIRLLSSISWGFWGMNGIFPRTKLAKKEVEAAKKFGFNCVQFHRNTGKTEVLKFHDRMGVLRYMEPGGGITALGKRYDPGVFDGKQRDYDQLKISGMHGEPQTFAEKYMEEKIIRMIRDHRRHPSLIMYVIQNEMAPDLRNPRIFYLLRRMHQEDPGRPIVLKSGVPVYNQAWMKPYDDAVYFDHGDGYSGWADKHTVGGPGVWKDNMYICPDSFTHKSITKREIMMWGEMLGAAVPDNHEKMIEYISIYGNDSYDLKDHREILDAYNHFLDKWEFRNAFPTAGKLFNEIGKKSYDFWGRVIETAKLSDENDFLVVSGWESTAIENHSGLLDNLRQFKSNPELISHRTKPLHPVFKPRTLVSEINDSIVFDLFLINETNQPHPLKAKLKMIDPQEKKQLIGEYDIPVFKKNKFVYQIDEELQTSELIKEGWYSFEFSVDNKSNRNISKDSILVVDTDIRKFSFPRKIALFDDSEELGEYLRTEPDIKTEPWERDGRHRYIIASHQFNTMSEAKVTDQISGTDDDPLYQTEHYGDSLGMRYTIEDVPKGENTITLKFAEVYFEYPEKRIFDVSVNDSLILNDFDIYARAGKNTAWDTTFTIQNNTGMVHIAFPRTKVNNAKLCAFRIDAPGKTIAINCGGKKYTDKSGLTWHPVDKNKVLDKELIDQVQDGAVLLLLPKNTAAVESYGISLNQHEVIDCQGNVGEARQPWMGSWVFIKDHPVFDGLPSDCALASYYQVGANDSDGLIINGNADVFAGYSRDHDRNIGAAGFRLHHGKGQIVFLGLYGLYPQAGNNIEHQMQSVISKRILLNTLQYLKEIR